jgi:hypothetical protein
MTSRPNETELLEDALAEGIAAIMAAQEEVARPEDMADLFLEELNRLWADPEPLTLS